MKKKTLKMKKMHIITSIIIIVTFFSIFIYYLDKNLMPQVLEMAEGEIKSLTCEIVNKNIAKIYSDEFKYSDLINIEKDNEGNIVLLRADTSKMNSLSSKMALESQENIKKIGDIGIKIPISYVVKNSIVGYFAPKILVKMQPIGRIETKYDSVFESAGINQTRHKIYIKFISKVRLVVPLCTKDIEITNEVPVSETIIVGKTPRTALDLQSPK